MSHAINLETKLTNYFTVCPLSPLSLSDFLLSLSVKDRRQYYRTSSSVPLDDIPVWTPTAGQTNQHQSKSLSGSFRVGW